MKSILLTTLVGAFALVSAHAQEVGKAAPQFSAKNVKGDTVSLAEQRGKIVVLEWVNFECPFVKKHYSSGNFGKLQEKYTGEGVVWISVNSAAKGKQGYLEPSELSQRATKEGNKASQFLVDTDGAVGKAYDAKVTPHMFIIDKEGKLVYNGAIDSKKTTENADVETADKYFAKALDAVIAGKEVENAKNEPYGCGVKY
ncbi:MAG: redoxin domain-containing protein [Verrucomicrobiaceae bacterium]|nr:MAG: redoxin domain-containing protein [Verrucomicrobiaceae bacterium]